VEGLLKKIARVLGVTAFSIRPTSQDQPHDRPLSPKSSDTGTAPATPAAAAKFGQAGDR
jgi:hypothetical protein